MQRKKRIITKYNTKIKDKFLQPTVHDSKPEWLSVNNSELQFIQSTPEEIRRAVECNAIQKGIIFVEIITNNNTDEFFKKLEDIAKSIDKENILDKAEILGIDVKALDLLDSANPPIPYVYYFCLPEILLKYPELYLYYRNIAMLSDKVMKDLGMFISVKTKNISFSEEKIKEIAIYFNRIISSLLIRTGVSQYRHIEMFMANLGDAIGGSFRNEIGRLAMISVLRPLIEHLWQNGQLKSLTFSLRTNLIPGKYRQEKQIFYIKPEIDIIQFLDELEAKFVKYQEIQLENDISLLIDKKIRWRDESGKSFEASSDLHGLRRGDKPRATVLWAAEVKGGADPAGSDEHWKTASRALHRILEAAKKSGHSKPPLSFIGTTIVPSVALEIRAWIKRGDLVSAYNLTKIIEQPEYRQRFVGDVMAFLGL